MLAFGLYLILLALFMLVDLILEKFDLKKHLPLIISLLAYAGLTFVILGIVERSHF